jgi:hypothetical protein
MLFPKQLLWTVALFSGAQARYYKIVGFTSYDGNLKSNADLDYQSQLRWCNQNPRCLAFDTKGDAKKHLAPRSEWEPVNSNPKKPYTMYVKESALIPADSYEDGYEHYKGYAILGDSFVRVVNSLNDQKQWCNRRSKCIGFNANGWMKNKRVPQHKWSWVGVDKSTVFIKGRVANRPAA